MNIMFYDYSGPWDNFTGIDAPLYGRWGEGYIGHHTESKGWLLANATDETSGIYCPASASPNITYSRQEGWLNYYEILQFWHNETVEDPRWGDLVLGRENWNIYDHLSGNVDG